MSRSLKAHYHAHKGLPLLSVFSQMQSTPYLSNIFLKNLFNIILCMYSKQSLLWSFHQNVCICFTTTYYLYWPANPISQRSIWALCSSLYQCPHLASSFMAFLQTFLYNAYMSCLLHPYLLYHPYSISCRTEITKLLFCNFLPSLLVHLSQHQIHSVPMLLLLKVQLSLCLIS